jgi:hypothetical protein
VDVLSNHLDIDMSGSVHICSFNRLTRTSGITGALEILLNAQLSMENLAVATNFGGFARFL